MHFYEAFNYSFDHFPYLWWKQWWKLWKNMVVVYSFFA